MHAQLRLAVTSKTLSRDGSAVPIPFFDQFALPRGPLGVVAGWALAWHNQQANRQCIDALELGSHTAPRVLEIGFGPGWGLEQLAVGTQPRPDGWQHLTWLAVNQAKTAKVLDTSHVARIGHNLCEMLVNTFGTPGWRIIHIFIAECVLTRRLAMSLRCGSSQTHNI